MVGRKAALQSFIQGMYVNRKAQELAKVHSEKRADIQSKAVGSGREIPASASQPRRPAIDLLEMSHSEADMAEKDQTPLQQLLEDRVSHADLEAAVARAVEQAVAGLAIPQSPQAYPFRSAHSPPAALDVSLHTRQPVLPRKAPNLKRWCSPSLGDTAVPFYHGHRRRRPGERQAPELFAVSASAQDRLARALEGIRQLEEVRIDRTRSMKGLLLITSP